MLDRPDIYKLRALELSMADPNSMGVIKGLEEVYPALAAKLFEGNKLMQNMVMSGRNMMAIMDYPMCGKCETLALLSGNNQCTCTRVGCNSTTKNPVTLRTWLFYELKKKMTNEQLEDLEYKIDAIAASMLRKFKNQCRSTYEEHNHYAREKMLAKKLNADKTEEEPTVIHGKINLPADAIILTDTTEEE